MGEIENSRNHLEKVLDERGVDYGIFAEKLTYCMSKECKDKTLSTNFLINVLSTSKGRRFRLSMKCAKCGKNKSVFVSERSIKFVEVPDKKILEELINSDDDE